MVDKTTKQVPLGQKAVAITTDDDRANPIISAKGRGYNAERILEIAFSEGIKVRQDKELTDLLDAFDVQSPIPLEALHAVSLILERVYAHEQEISGTAHNQPGETTINNQASFT